MQNLDLIGKNYFTSNLSALILVGIIAFTLIFSFFKEKKFIEAKTTVSVSYTHLDVYKRQGQYSIRINSQWRICFKWEDDAAHDVEIVDYH